MEQVTYWNDMAQQKTFTSKINYTTFKEYVSVNAKILDIGCGYGRTLSDLYEHGYHNLWGCDFSTNMIGRAKTLSQDFHLKVSEAGKMGYKNDSFDVVILFSVLTCIVENGDQEILVNEIRRILKPNGLLFVNDFLLNQDERNIVRYNQYLDKYKNYGVFELHDGAILRHHDEEYIKSLFNIFYEESYNRIQKTTMNGHISNAFIFTGRKTR